MGTILDDKKHKDNHFLSLFLNGIIMLGEQAVEQAIAHLMDRKANGLQALDTHPCPPGQVWNGTQCVDDLPK